MKHLVRMDKNRRVNQVYQLMENGKAEDDGRIADYSGPFDVV